MNIASLLKDSNLSPTLLEDRGAYIQAVRQGVPGKIVEQAVKALGGVATANGQKTTLNV